MQRNITQSLKKKLTAAICNNMYEPEGHYAEENK